LLRETQLEAYARTFSELTCADIMSRPVIAVSATTTTTAAWDLLKRHGIKALPVTDASNVIIGIVTKADLVDTGAVRKLATLAENLRQRFRGRPTLYAGTVGAVMIIDVCTVDAAKPIVELVPIFTNYGHHHIPVLDESRRLVGMITQLDLISGLYRQAHFPQRLVA
jgi:CBS domain-containing membrane protein